MVGHGQRHPATAGNPNCHIKLAGGLCGAFVSVSSGTPPESSIRHQWKRRFPSWKRSPPGVRFVPCAPPSHREDSLVGGCRRLAPHQPSKEYMYHGQADCRYCFRSGLCVGTFQFHPHGSHNLHGGWASRDNGNACIFSGGAGLAYKLVKR